MAFVVMGLAMALAVGHGVLLAVLDSPTVYVSPRIERITAVLVAGWIGVFAAGTIYAVSASFGG